VVEEEDDDDDDSHRYLTMRVENGTHQGHHHILRYEIDLPVTGKTPFADQETGEVKQRIVD
jgi:hypothetical protein